MFSLKSNVNYQDMAVTGYRSKGVNSVSSEEYNDWKEKAEKGNLEMVCYKITDDLQMVFIK